jgi:5'-phosphate synthase pdxT subunit
MVTLTATVPKNATSVFVPKIGVLALQGDYEAHETVLAQSGAIPLEVRTLSQLLDVDAMVIPGGESTVMGSLMIRFGLLDALIRRITEGMPVFGTCAGLILLAKRLEGKEQPGLRVLDVTVRRNAYGTQVDSFRANLKTLVPGVPEIEGVFIRAPKIIEAGAGVEVLSRYGDSPVLVRQGSILGASFHPELVFGSLVHKFFIESMVRRS